MARLALNTIAWTPPPPPIPPSPTDLVAGGLIGQDEEGFKALAPQGDDEDDDRVQSHARAAISVLRFALDMLASAREVRLPHTGEPAQIRIGIHAGPVVSGLVGLQLPKYSLFGDTVGAPKAFSHTCCPQFVPHNGREQPRRCRTCAAVAHRLSAQNLRPHPWLIRHCFSARVRVCLHPHMLTSLPPGAAQMNHAARLESTSRPGCIHVSDSLKSLLETEVPGLPWVATGGVMLKVGREA